MNKLILLLISIFLLFGCTKQIDNIIITLESEKGYGVHMPGRAIIFPSRDSIEYKGVPDNITEYVIRSIPMQKNQSLFYKYKNGKIDEKTFTEISNHYKLDTTKLTNQFVDSDVIALIGTNDKNKRVIIVDSDNNEDFNNEQIIEFNYPLSIEEQKKIVDSIPSIKTSFEYYTNNRIIVKEKTIKLSPYKGSLGLTFNTEKEIEKKYYLFSSIPEHKKGEIKIGKIKYDVFVSNGFTNPIFSNQNASIFFSKQNEKTPSELDGNIPYQIEDVFNSNGKDFKLEKISSLGDSLTLKYLGKNIRPIGITENFYVPKFNAKRLDNSIFELDQYKNKYILIDFWGTWCVPCIKVIPELKELHKDFNDKNFVLISVAYDSDKKKVFDFVNDKNMNWEHVFVNQQTLNKNSIVEKLKISSFPSTLLIDPNGKIIARNKEISELRKLLEEKTNAL